MVVTKGDSPNRRRSIAVASHAGSGQSTAIPRRRRAYSVVPRTSLSPQAKARRLLVPRKSILKASFTPDDLDGDPATQSTQAATDDDNITQSMDFTQDFRARIHDNASRKSFGRRVSFAEHAHVRVFQIPDKNQNNPQSPQSPASSSSDPPEPAAAQDENDYPGASSRRRSSIRFSGGSDDMDMTNIMSLHPPGSAILDEEFDDDEDDMVFSDDMDMDVTQVVQGNLARRRSSTGENRRDTMPPSAILDMSDDAIPESEGDLGSDPPGEQDVTQSSIAEESMVSEAASDKSQNMEFTIPLNKSLRPPPTEDPAWMALRQATHSGDTPIEPADESVEIDYNAINGGDMPLGDAVQRLMRARDSLSGQPQANAGDQYDEDTVSSMGSIEGADDGNQTLNISKVLGRVSMGGGTDLSSRMSMGFGETTMDESEVYGDVLAIRRQSMAPRQSLLPQASSSSGPSSQPPEPERPNPMPTVFKPPPKVFQPPPPSQEEANPASTSTSTSTSASTSSAPTKQTTVPVPFSFTSRPTTPSSSKPSTVTTPNSKGKSKPTFTAAFAPPTTRPSPKKPPQKRALSNENDADPLDVDADKPSPAKRQALEGKWTETTQSRTESQPAASTSQTTPKPRPLSPSKKSPFQSMGAQSAQKASVSTGAAPGSTLRRPTGYMARRKSLAAGPVHAPKSPRRAGGRMSLASGPQDAWTRFNKDAHPPPKPSQPPQTEEEGEQDQGASQQATTVRSPSPKAHGVGGEAVEAEQDPEEEAEQAMDLSTVDNQEFGAEEEEDDMEMDEDAVAVNKTEQWRDNVEAAGQYDEEEEMPAISISQFFTMTGIKFMDDLAAPRRSIHPSQGLTRQPREPEDIPLSEYVVAMAIDIPQLELYSRVSRDLQAWMEKSKSVFAEAEEEAEKVTPELFVEYARADEEGQAELLHQLNFIKINTRGHARSDWYDWKLKWVESLRLTADQAFADLESDARKLEELSRSAAEVIPDLEREYAKIMAELEQEQAEVAEIEACDQDYLNELKASIAEQNIEVEALKAEVAEHNEQLKWLESRLQETNAEKREIEASIAKAERVLKIQKSSTKVEVFQLKDELEALEELHMVRVIKVNSELFEYIYDSTFRVTIPCKNFKPLVPKIVITRLESTLTRAKDDFPKLTSLFHTCTTQILDEEDDNTVPKIVNKLGDYWTCCSQLRSHLRLLNIKYPIEIDVAPAPPPDAETASLPTFRVRASVMFPKVAGKAVVSYIFNLSTWSQWPLSIDSLDCAVEIVYGPLEQAGILKAVVDRLAEASFSDNYLLLDSCIGAQDLYDDPKAQE